MTIQESSPITDILPRSQPSTSHLGELLAADETIRAVRYQQLIGIARDEQATTGPHRPYNLSSETEAQCLVYRAMFSIPSPIPGSTVPVGPTSGTTVDDRGCVCIKVRAKNAEVFAQIEVVTIDGTSTTFGAATAGIGSTVGSGYETIEILTPTYTEGVLYPSGVSAGDTIAITIYARADSGTPGYIAGVMVEECDITDTTIPVAPVADVPTATALADFSTIADGTTDGDSIVISENGRVMMWSASISQWVPSDVWAQSPSIIGYFDGSQSKSDLEDGGNGFVFIETSGGTCTVSSNEIVMAGAGNGKAYMISPEIVGSGAAIPGTKRYYARILVQHVSLGSNSYPFATWLGWGRDDTTGGFHGSTGPLHKWKGAYMARRHDGSAYALGAGQTVSPSFLSSTSSNRYQTYDHGDEVWLETYLSFKADAGRNNTDTEVARFRNEVLVNLSPANPLDIHNNTWNTADTSGIRFSAGVGYTNTGMDLRVKKV